MGREGEREKKREGEREGVSGEGEREEKRNLIAVTSYNITGLVCQPLKTLTTLQLM